MTSYAWNQKATMVFIEAPCGVGFSYSDNKVCSVHIALIEIVESIVVIIYLNTCISIC